MSRCLPAPALSYEQTHNKPTGTQDEMLEDLHVGYGGHTPGPPCPMPCLPGLDSLQLVGVGQMWTVSPATLWPSYGSL